MVRAQGLRIFDTLITLYRRVVRVFVLAMATAAALGLLAMMAVTCLDVVMRIFKRPLLGAYDIVEVLSAVTIACALPYTTAVKGHVAVEFFFQKLPRWGRIVVDSIMRLLAIALFGLLSWRCVLYAQALKDNGRVTSTLQLPLFWVPYVIALSSSIVVLVIVHNLLRPGKGMMAP